MFGVFVLETDKDDSIPDAYTDDVDFIGIGRILDAAPRGPLSTFDISGVSVLDDESVLDVVTSDFASYLNVSQHFPLIAPPAPTTHIYDVDDPREIRIGSSLSPDERSRLIDLLRSYLDVFAWSYEDMPGLDPTIVKEEIQKQLSVGFLSVVEYPEWLANVVPVPKKDGKHCRASDVILHGWFFRYNHILMAREDMVKTFMPFGFKNAEPLIESRYYSLHDMMHRDVEIESQEVHLWGDFGKLLGHIVSERGIEVDPEKIEPYLTCLPRGEKEIRDSRCLLSPPVLVPPTPGRPLLLYLSVSDMALGCMLAQLDDLGKERAIYYLSKRMLEYECKYIMIEHLCLAWPVLTGRLMRWLVLLTEFDIHYVTQKSIISMTSITGWRLYFDGAANQSGFGIGILLISPQGDHIPRSVRWRSTGFQLGYSRLRNQFADALATLASLIVIPAGVNVRPLLIETRSAPAYYCLIGEIEDQIELPCIADRVMREVHAGVCGLHMGGHMLPLWGIDIIGKISPKSSSGHEYILVAIDYFTKWVEAASYARLTAARGEVDTLTQEYGIQHHRSVKANKNIKRILRKMVRPLGIGREAPFALWAYRGATVEIEMRSLRVALEQRYIRGRMGPVSL
ncbi:hypothetical protein AAG906_024569 [Vitis piasezkii]